MRVGIVGHGRIGRIHAAAIAELDGLDLVGVADPSPAEASPAGVSTFSTADELLRRARPDVLVVATPMWTHAPVVADLRAHFTGRIVVEKPVALTVADVEATLDLGVDVLYHAAFAPEVDWAVAAWPRWTATHGAATSIEMAFADPYAADLARAEATLGDSWADSGINALSVLARLVDPERCVRRHPLAGDSSTFEATIACLDRATGAAVDAHLVTSWAATEPSKSTRVHFADGAALVLDHQAVLGRLVAGGQVHERHEPASAHPRLVQHYLRSFTRLLVDGQRSFPLEVDRRLHRLLLEPAG